MKKDKFMHSLVDNSSPISMKEILKELKEDRKESDGDEMDVSQRLASAWEKYRKCKSVENSFSEYVKWLKTNFI